MESDWDWKNLKTNLKKEGIYYELWEIWRAICATRFKRKITRDWERI